MWPPPMTVLPPAISANTANARFAMAWLIAIAVAGAVSLATAILNDGDTFWHVAAGRWMIAYLRCAGHLDPFSFTCAAAGRG